MFHHILRLRVKKLTLAGKAGAMIGVFFAAGILGK
jgi:hypothetical protein